MSHRLPLLLASLAALSAGTATGQEEPPPPPSGTSGLGGQNQPGQGQGQAFSDPSQLFTGKSGAFFGLGFTNISGEGLYASTTVNTEFNLGPVGLGLALPLNLLVWNKDDCCGPDPDANGNHPHSRDYKAYGGILRKRDWNEWQDYARLIRYVRYGHKRDPLYVLAGQMWGASIGHGTLLNRYSNSLSIDHPKFGLAVDLNSDFVGVETITDNVTGPTILGGRVYVRPFGETPILRGLAFGATLVSDRTAPRSLAYVNGPDGSIALKQDTSNGSVIVDNFDAMYAAGVDVEYEVLRNSLIQLIPYVDGNRLLGAGNGLHAGVLTNLFLPVPIIAIDLQTRFEYRFMQPGYIPEYFDQTYDLGRIQYAVEQGNNTTTYLPKYAAAQQAKALGGKPRKGYYGEVSFGFGGLVQVGGLYQDYEGDPNGASLGLFATLPKFELIKLSAYYLRKNMAGLSDAFHIDERSLLAASAAYKMFGPLYLRIDYKRQWQLRPGDSQIKAIDSFSAGLATFVPF
jgi:hypothetical protein